ncbi:hypothetical protein JMJ35_008735 [Cladonia borealis]|uniref:Uncharacterized protein n=1 Tax=Cladonia borealis TaxID=184061 RepID=A0AA39QV45_9LECA|nr:hypothetical protein JMJ35_008735 [Cladonia borealis]
MIPLNFHLPLNAIDQRNQPPKSYLLTQDFLLLTAGALWTLAYILYIQQSIHDTSYGMPLLSLFLNLSWEITWCRFLGTLCVTALCQWKYWHYPADYAWIGTPLATFLFVATEIGDLIYPFVFHHVWRVETGAPIPPHDPILYLSEVLVDLRARFWSFIDSHPSEVAGVVFVVVTWGIFTAVLWCVDSTSGLEGLRKLGDLKKRRKNGEVLVGTWDKDTDRRNKGPRQKTSKARSKAADYRDQIIKSMTEQATVQ